MHNINTLQKKKKVRMWKFETSLCVFVIVLLFVFLNRFFKKLKI